MGLVRSLFPSEALFFHFGLFDIAPHGTLLFSFNKSPRLERTDNLVPPPLCRHSADPLLPQSDLPYMLYPYVIFPERNTGLPAFWRGMRPPPSPCRNRFFFSDLLLYALLHSQFFFIERLFPLRGDLTIAGRPTSITINSFSLRSVLLQCFFPLGQPALRSFLLFLLAGRTSPCCGSVSFSAFLAAFQEGAAPLSLQDSCRREKLSQVFLSGFLSVSPPSRASVSPFPPVLNSQRPVSRLRACWLSLLVPSLTLEFA